MSEYKPCVFDREEYLKLGTAFERFGLEDANQESCEFNDDAEDLAFELAYTRYFLAKTEAQYARLAKENEDIKTAIVDLMQRYAV